MTKNDDSPYSKGILEKIEQSFHKYIPKRQNIMKNYWMLLHPKIGFALESITNMLLTSQDKEKFQQKKWDSHDNKEPPKEKEKSIMNDLDGRK